ncbi:MAG: hypothetical protein K5868_10790 [Lachnospiraceae bacterium]|nr:hypothetical protein [Lachnospiraceae bacterium]
MTLAEYLEHYLVASKMLTFLGLALVCTLVSVMIIILAALCTSNGRSRADRRRRFHNRAYKLTERYYEMIFSATSILSFLSAYYLIERFITEGEFHEFWSDHADMLLLVMIIASCVINSIFDRVLIPLKSVNTEEKGSVRLIGMLYIILIFMYIKFIYENNNYDGFIIYFLGLMVGRYAYFDSSFMDFVNSIRKAAHNIPLLLLGLANTAVMCLYGFTTKYLLKSNGVLVSTFFAHLFLVVAIFIVFHSRFIRLFVKVSATESAAALNRYDNYEDDYYEDRYDDADYEDDYSEYDNNEEYYDDYDGEEY